MFTDFRCVPFIQKYTYTYTEYYIIRKVRPSESNNKTGQLRLLNLRQV